MSGRAWKQQWALGLLWKVPHRFPQMQPQAQVTSWLWSNFYDSQLLTYTHEVFVSPKSSKSCKIKQRGELFVCVCMRAFQC